MRHKGLMRATLWTSLLTLSLLTALPAAAQSEEEAVMAVIHRLFDGMRAGDGDVVRNVFTADALMHSVVVRDGVTSLRPGSAAEFANAVGQPHDKVWDERIWDPQVHVDGHLATAWTPYAFYLGGQFSHCGANSFQLMKGSEGWKIVYIVDSRRQADCEVPESVKQGK
ncbi:MAG: nuclear transport factor 2 family protein [Rhodothermales bacterium]